jgi:hypothetical protein
MMEFISVDPVEYTLHLGTGEEMLFTELDDRVIPALQDKRVVGALHGILRRCTPVTHSILQEAKLGHTKSLENLLRTPPIGSLLKLDKPICSQIGCCVMADVRRCTTNNIKGKLGIFPDCWAYAVDIPIIEIDKAYVMMAAGEISRCVVNAWKANRYVLIVSEG